MSRPKGFKSPSSEMNIAIAQAARNLFKEAQKILEERPVDPTQDALYRIYQKMDMMGFKNGNPVIQAGLAPYHFRDQVIRIQNVTDGHVTTCTMSNLVSVAVQSTLEVLGEIRVERAEARAREAGEVEEEGQQATV